jgi:hypothetical protein
MKSTLANYSLAITNSYANSQAATGIYIGTSPKRLEHAAYITYPAAIPIT